MEITKDAFWMRKNLQGWFSDPKRFRLMRAGNSLLIFDRTTSIATDYGDYHQIYARGLCFDGVEYKLGEWDGELMLRNVGSKTHKTPPTSSDPPPPDTQTLPEVPMTARDLIMQLMNLPQDAQLELLCVGYSDVNRTKQVYQRVKVSGFMVEHSSKGDNRKAALVMEATMRQPASMVELEADYADGTIRLEHLKRVEAKEGELVEPIFTDPAPPPPPTKTQHHIDKDLYDRLQVGSKEWQEWQRQLDPTQLNDNNYKNQNSHKLQLTIEQQLQLQRLEHEFQMQTQTKPQKLITDNDDNWLKRFFK